MIRKPAHEELERKVKNLEPGAHLCCIYEREEEHRAILTPFLRQGLERGEKVLYIVDARTAGEVLGYLRQDGLDVAPYLKRGQLAILTADESYMQEGIFDPDGMISLLREETRRALDEGYSALRVTGEMTWALRGVAGSERLVEYEAKLNNFFPGSKCLAICQYDRRRFEPEVLLDVLATHPIAIVGTEVFENSYYMPAEDFLGPEPARAKLNNRLESLAARKRAEKEASYEQGLMRTLLDNIPDYVYFKDKDRRFVRASSFFCDLFGCSLEDIIGKKDEDLFPEEIAEETTSDDRHVIETGIPLIDKEEGASIDGGEHWVLTTKFPWRDKRGNIIGLFGISREITDRKRAEEALRESENKFRSLFEASQELIYLVDPQGYVMECNPAVFAALGYAEAEIRGRRLNAFVSPSHRKDPDQEIPALIARGTDRHEVELVRKDGTHFVVDCTAAVVRDDAGQVLHILATQRDITDRKRAEEALQKAHDELEQRVEERTAKLRREIKERKQAEKVLAESENRLRHLSSQLLAAQENERKRIAGEVHDSVGQTLAALKMSVENSIAHGPTPACVESLKAVVPMVQNAMEEVRRIQADLRPSLLDDLGILATIDWFCRELQVIYSRMRIEKHINIQENEVPDPLKIIIYRVLQEAMNNVAKHSKADSVRLSLKKSEGKVHMITQDDGTGFDLKKVLLRDSPKGLGLTSMKERTELSGGSFAIQPVKGGGTTVRASWPLQ